MPPELIAAIAGPMAGALFGIAGFLSRRNANLTDKQLDDIKESIELISHQVTSIQIQLPSTYVTKDEFSSHVAREDSFQSQVLQEMRELREEIIVIRVNSHG